MFFVCISPRNDDRKFTHDNYGNKTYIFQGGRLQFVVILSILNFPFLFWVYASLGGFESHQTSGFPQVRRDFERHKKEATYCSVFSFLLIHDKWFFFFPFFYFFWIDIWTEGEVNKIMFNFYLQLLSQTSCTTIILSALSMDFPQVVLKGSCLTDPAPENRFVKQEGSYK